MSHEARRPGFRGFRLQVRVAAGDGVGLARPGEGVQTRSRRLGVAERGDLGAVRTATAIGGRVGNANVAGVGQVERREVVQLGREQFRDGRRTDSGLDAAARAEPVVDLPFQVGLPAFRRTRTRVLRHTVAERQRHVLGEGHVLDDRNQQFGEQVGPVQEARGRQLLVEASHQAGLQAAVRTEVEVQFAIAGAEGRLQRARRQLEQVAVDDRFHDRLLDDGQVLGFQADPGRAGRINRGLAEQVQTVGAVAARSRVHRGDGGGVQQGLDTITTDVAALDLVQDRTTERRIDVVLPGLGAGQVALGAQNHLPDVVGVVAGPAAQIVEALGEGERGQRVRAGRQDLRQLGRDERVGDRDVPAGRAAGRGRRQFLQGVVVGVQRLDVGLELIVDLVVHAREQVPALHRQDQDVVRLEVVREDVRREVRGDGRFRARITIDVIRRARGDAGAEQAAVGVEAEAGPAARVGATVAAAENGVHRRLAGQVGGRQASRAAREDGGRAGSLRRPLARVLVHLGAVEVAGVENGVTLAVVEVAAERDVGRPLFAVALFRQAVLRVELNALEVVLQDEVDHPRDSVGAVGRGRAARDDFNAIDQRGRNGVGVNGAAGGRTHRTTAVEQHQVTPRAQAAQVDEGPTVRGRVVRLRRQAGRHLRQGVQVVLERRGARVRDVLLLNRQDRALGDGVATRDARAGHHDLIDAGDFFLRRALREGRRGKTDRRHPGDHRGRQQTLAIFHGNQNHSSNE
ncbi:hypothetical protein D3C77_310450 [compost metagenome]